MQERQFDYPVYRSQLIFPGNTGKPEKIAKADSCQADICYIDLEDSVPASEKAQAVRNAKAALEATIRNFGIRVNPPKPYDSPSTALSDIQDLYDKLSEVARRRIELLIVPKIQDPSEIIQIEEALDHIAPQAQLMLVVETVTAVRRAFDLMTQSRKAVGVIIGWEDLSEELHIAKPDNALDNKLFLHIACELSLAAKECGIPAYDGVNKGIDDAGLKCLEEQAIGMKEIGYQGKILIHPTQIALVNSVFSPSAKEIARAQELLRNLPNDYKEKPRPFLWLRKMISPREVKYAEALLKKAISFGLL